MRSLLKYISWLEVGLDVRKIVGFVDLDKEMQEELVSAFPKPVVGFVQ